jgi:hypothetical protein
MNLKEIIANYSKINEDLVVYAKKVNERFLSSSEVVLLELTEEEQGMKTFEIEKVKCPGFTYFLEMFIIKEMMEDFENNNQKKEIEEKVEIVIHYAEFDA